MRHIVSNWRSTLKYESNLKRGIVSRIRKPLPISPMGSSRSPTKRSPKKNRNQSGISSSTSPSFDISQPSTSGYSTSKSKSSQNCNAKKTVNASPKKSRHQNLSNNLINNSKRNGSLKRNKVMPVFATRSTRNRISRSVSPERCSRNLRKRRPIKRVVDDDETDKEDKRMRKKVTKEDFTINEDTMISEEVVNHFNSDTEIEDKGADNTDNDSDATEIENEINSPILSRITRRKSSRITYSERNSYQSLPQRRVRQITQRRVRLKASEESESTQSSIASGSHSNYSNESQSSTSLTIHSEVSEESRDFMSADDVRRRSTRKNRGITSRWRSYEPTDDELGINSRRVSLGLRNKSVNNNRREMSSSRNTRSRNSNKERVKYTYDDEDFEYEDNRAHLSDTISSRGRVRKFKAHARFGH